MEIKNLASAQEWVAAWGGNPRPGILRACLDGLMSCRALDNSRGFNVSALDSAIAYISKCPYADMRKEDRAP